MLFHIILVTAGITGSTLQFSDEDSFWKVVAHHEDSGWTVAYDDELPMGGISMTLESPKQTKLMATISK